MINLETKSSILLKKNLSLEESSDNPDPKIWVNTAPKLKENSLFIKYGLVTILVIFSLISITVTKNETRGLQKKINILEKSIDSISYDLYRAKLEHEVLTSPENISKLAKENLELELDVYKKSQIKNLNANKEKTALKIKNKLFKEKKLQISKKIKEKKIELKKIQTAYSDPKKIPTLINKRIAKNISDIKNELRYMYKNPRDPANSKKIRNWASFQIVKVFLDIPVVPGK